MAKKKSLTDVLKSKKLPAKYTPPIFPVREPTSYVPKCRRGKKAVMGFFSREVSSQLKILGIELNDKSIQDLLSEALNDLFLKYKKPPIA